MIELVGILFLGIEYLVLKNIFVYKGCGKYIKFPFKIWHLILLIIINIIPVINVIVFTLFIIYTFMSLGDEIKINYNKDSAIFKFLNKEL